eukprot:m.94065 g.94065  ORF g.94065 m.94065 type:complete len:182 (-) comp13425_c0_seq1:701-1246(-)
MWTWVSPERPEGGEPKLPWCCLKNCSLIDGCPAPEPEQGTYSGAKSPSTYGKCPQNSSLCFTFTVDWASGSTQSTLPTFGFAVRKLEAIVYPEDGHTYAYVDIVNYTDYYYPDSYSSEVGVYYRRMDTTTGLITESSFHGGSREAGMVGALPLLELLLARMELCLLGLLGKTLPVVVLTEA